MSKVVGKNKSGTTLVNAIIENCKKSEGDENGKDYNRNLTDNFCKNFLLYFKVVTGKEFSFGELSDSVFNELKENLVRTTQKYEVKKLHEWFKVNSWKDVFPDDIEDTQEWIFRENMHTLIIDLYKKIFDTENEDVFSHNGIKARELIYDLMGIDFSYYFKSKIIQGETDEETVSK